MMFAIVLLYSIIGYTVTQPILSVSTSNSSIFDGLFDIKMIPTLNYFVSISENGSFMIWDAFMTSKMMGSVGCNDKIISMDIFFDQDCFIVGCQS